MSFLQVQNLCFAYQSEWVLEHLSFSVEKGEFVIIAGPNGAGKTTLLRLLAGLKRPTTGTIFLEGGAIEEKRRDGKIRIVPQQYNKNAASFPATVEEIVLLGARKTKKGKEKKEIAHAMLSLVGMDGLGPRRIGELSGGQQQRVILAQALAGQPELLLLDEPTSGIDYRASEELLHLLAELNVKQKITILMISHDIERASRYAKRIICIDRHLCYDGDGAGFMQTHMQSPERWNHGG